MAQEIDGDRDPDLGHRVLGRYPRSLEPEVRLDPFEEQLDVPTDAIGIGYVSAGIVKLFPKKASVFSRFLVMISAPQQMPCRPVRCLIGHSAERLLHRVGIDAAKSQIVFTRVTKKE